MRIQDLFLLGMKRNINELKDGPPNGININLGAGLSHIPGTVSFDWPEWDAEAYHIPYTDNTVDVVHAYHFLEHLCDPRRMLKEIQRVLKTGGILNICVPHAICTMSLQDLDHKAFFVLDTWENAFNSPYYVKDRDGWKFEVNVNILIAVTERNTAILTQLIKQ